MSEINPIKRPRHEKAVDQQHSLAESSSDESADPAQISSIRKSSDQNSTNDKSNSNVQYNQNLLQNQNHIAALMAMGHINPLAAPLNQNQIHQQQMLLQAMGRSMPGKFIMIKEFLSHANLHNNNANNADLYHMLHY
jgi:hypothetical protein